MASTVPDRVARIRHLRRCTSGQSARSSARQPLRFTASRTAKEFSLACACTRPTRDIRVPRGGARYRTFPNRLRLGPRPGYRRRGRLASELVTRYARNALHEGSLMALAAERMRAMRERRRARGLRELRMVVPDARSKQVRRRVAKQVASLDRARELDAMRWIEAVSEFDAR